MLSLTNIKNTKNRIQDCSKEENLDIVVHNIGKRDQINSLNCWLDLRVKQNAIPFR